MIPEKPNTLGLDEPNTILLYGPPKSGKTSICALLPEHLILDLNNETDYIENGRVVKIVGWSGLSSSKEERHTKTIPEYTVNEFLVDTKNVTDIPFLVIDNLTWLEDIALKLALEKYKKTNMGKNFDGNILSLPNGAGYLYHRLAMRDIVNALRKRCKRLILIAHVQDKLIESYAEGKDHVLDDIALTGKLKFIIPASVDAIGYVTIKTNDETGISENVITFGGRSLIGGNRVSRLNGKSVVIGQWDEENHQIVNVNWDKIFKL